MMQRHIQFRVVLSSMDLEQFHSRLDRFELNITDAPAIRLASRLQRSANWNEKHGGVCRQMGQVLTPRSLRAIATVGFETGKFDSASGVLVSAVAGLFVVASFSGAEAQSSELPPVNVDAPVARARPVSSKPTADHVRARNALRRAAQRQGATQQAQAVSYPNAGGLAPPDANPYADAAAPYKVDRVQASGKFPEPLLNTPKTITVMSKEVLEDKHVTALKEIGRSTAGVTLGSGEGGNAFGDRFFIRGFDARNDVFIDGIRDPAVSIRENFFTEQIEILRGPASAYAGRAVSRSAR